MTSFANGATNGYGDHKMSDSPVRKIAKVGTSELEQFDALFPQLVADLTAAGSKEQNITAALDWFKKVCEYNVPFGKKNRGIMVSQSLRFLKKGEVTEEDLNLARILGWCIEWLQAFFLVQDDVMDQSVTRRGQPCWYRVDKVGLEAVNDGMFLESSVFLLLKKYFRDLPCYVDLMELFHQTTHQTIVGQCLDMTTSPGPGGEVDFSRFSPERYNSIVQYKTAYYSFYLPVACAMYMAGISDDLSHAKAKAILLKMGHFFQVQDDYLDCYGEPAVIGKVGTDIEESKCSWLVVQALQRVTPEQRQILQDNYAQQDPKKVARVKELYLVLNLPKVYAEFEDSSYKEIMELIDTESGDLPKEIFITFANKIYKRNK